ncbi:hypothetical protein P4110_05735 [Pseudomonas aeruginosa]|nr:hypothetical protein [Pseudomonas aeruginosa]
MWSFPREDVSREVQARQLALAIRDEVVDPRPPASGSCRSTRRLSAKARRCAATPGRTIWSGPPRPSACAPPESATKPRSIRTCATASSTM